MPFGDVPEELQEWLVQDIGGFLGVPCRRLPPRPIPEGSFEPRRNQHISTKILSAILQEVPKDASKVLGIIDRDLCILILTFVYGEAQLGGVGAVVSLSRLRQEFYGLAPDEPVFLERLHKECLHELGHTYGLIHCQHLACVMHLSNTIQDVDLKGRAMCRDCGDILQSRINGG
ncbi:MAG: archaemetzincin family Zn-dependent metalloprotease [Deltaproteobacteria bacterium]|nr:archaemetzincin family Zn-dependent metalloprotease [Deltaproteobacteria bacterium]